MKIISMNFDLMMIIKGWNAFYKKYHVCIKGKNKETRWMRKLSSRYSMLKFIFKWNDDPFCKTTQKVGYSKFGQLTDKIRHNRHSWQYKWIQLATPPIMCLLKTFYMVIMPDVLFFFIALLHSVDYYYGLSIDQTCQDGLG